MSILRTLTVMLVKLRLRIANNFMGQIKPETQEQWLQRLEAAPKTLTQDQIDACAWVMGGSGVGWTKQLILDSLSPISTAGYKPSSSETF
jgi:hypothetical protein